MTDQLKLQERTGTGVERLTPVPEVRGPRFNPQPVRLSLWP